MGLLGKFFHHSSGNHEEEIKSKGFEISECSFECDSCTSKFPASLKFDEEAELWDSTKPFGLHLLVSTGKSDWPHDATGESNTLSNAVAKWGSDHSQKYSQIGNIKVSTSSLSSDEFLTDDDYIKEQKGDILILPFFVWVKGVTIKETSSVLSSLIPDLIKFRNEKVTDLQIPTTYSTSFPSVRFEIDTSKSYVFLCSHRTRDKRCGVTAPIMKKEMDLHLRDLGLYRDVGDNTPNGVRVAFINHIGGHKYAANVIIYLRSSGKIIWLARCKPNNVVPIIDECIVNDGKVWPNNIRLLQKLDPIDW
ncbi:Sucrase/ferredoxin-like-domain-containing protein [Scheffersomyces amazonensis]|uniref:Sucrase/ferredoxin-like-domain-containing protein n=1 Tax=Scheffersomyces amazonensis TaxID=1078765 RepID=UPI00315C76D1